MSDSDYTIHPYYSHIRIARREEWKGIEGYEGRYQVSNKGRVKSLARSFFRTRKNRKSCWVKVTERILKPGRETQGHVFVVLSREGEQKMHRIHHLVLAAFVCPRPKGKECCHYPDKTPDNNRLENLRWDTHSENALDTARYQGNRRKHNKETVRKIRKMFETGEYTRAEIARHFDITWTNADAIITGKSWNWLE